MDNEMTNGSVVNDAETSGREAPVRRRSARKTSPGCVGLPVQYCDGTDVVPAVLQRRSLTQPDLWDVRVFVTGAMTSVVRSGVKYSATPRPGHWNHLPE